MTNERQKRSNTSYIFIDKNDAWEIINNQIEVQEQLSRRGQHILNILAALAVIVVGTTITVEGISNPDVESATNYLPVAQEDLWAFLYMNIYVLLLLAALSIVLFFLFIIRNYYVSRPESLMPGLGREQERPIFVLANDDYRKPNVDQYAEWIKSNEEVLLEKRQQSIRSHKNLIVSIVLFSLCFLIYRSIQDGGVLSLIIVDIFLLSIYPIITFLGNEADDSILTPASVTFEETEISSLKQLNIVEVVLYSLIYLLIVLLILLFVLSFLYVYFF